jgi:homoserine kinase type II
VALLDSGFHAAARAVELAGPGAVADLGRQWTELAQSVAPVVLETLSRAASVVVALQPCLRDMRPEHVLFTSDRVTGLVDFGAMGYDSVAADLARLLAEWLGSDRALRAEALEAYTAIRSIGAAELLLIDEFDRSAALLGAGHWVRWHFLEGRTFEDPDAVGRGLRKGLNRLTALAGMSPP